jgi:4-amino-4-deoxychorismate lyase
MEFIETLLVKNKIENLKYHQQRINKTFSFFKWKNPINLYEIFPQKNSRMRITYTSKGIKTIEYFPLKQREFKTFKITPISFNYRFKYKNRKKFDIPKNTDELILVKNHLITDTTISNLAFFDSKEWLTPKYPLLEGTKRAELIEKGVLKEANIHTSDLKYFEKMAMINAILGFYVIDDFDIIR